jgi:mRNA interferase MazF
MKDEKINRGDIYLANLNPYKGSEQGGKRPVIIIQNNVGNHYSPTVIVTAVTSRFFKKRALPTHVPLDNEELEKNSLALLEQIRTIDKSRLIRKIGRVPEEKMKEIGAAIHVSLDLNDEDEQHIDASG